jgi:carbamoyltransferase
MEAGTEALFELAVDGEPRWLNDIRRALHWDPDGGVHFDVVGLEAVLREAQEGLPDRLSDREPYHLDVQRRRRALAASFTRVLADVLIELARSVAPDGQVAFGGSLFASPRLNSALRASLGSQTCVSPVPERVGLALGAALSCAPAKPSMQGLDLGPVFSDEQIKGTLDNCRIDYVYEPDWPRLLSRISALLSRGKVVAWFHGAAEFGPRPQGCRSVLGDPSNRYVRHNINEYLFRRAFDATLALVVREEDAALCFPDPIQSPFTLLRTPVKPELGERLQSVLDGRRSATIQTINRQRAPELHDLLGLHAQSTGVPGLVHSPLLTPGGGLALTPRSAVQAVFASAIDALVIGRFLVMKDYWLLRSAGN